MCNVIIFFRQKDLFNILKAYAIYDPKTGYCQVQSYHMYAYKRDTTGTFLCMVVL